MRRRLCPKEALFTPSFIAVCSANLLFFIASFMMVPVLPIYLLDGLHASKSVVGIILSAYMIGALVMRPLSGFLADQFPRKILFLVCGILFAAQFEGYLLFNALALVGIVRALHGMSFGALSTSAATLAVDVIPIAKLGTGIGLYGMMGSLAMALGPMIGMLVLEAGSYDAVFITAMGCAAGGILLGLLVKKQRVTASRGEKISLDRFFLKKRHLCLHRAGAHGLRVRAARQLPVRLRPGAPRHGEPRLLLPAHVPRAHPQPPFRGRHDRQGLHRPPHPRRQGHHPAGLPCSSSSCPRKPCSSAQPWPSGSASG